ncbi:MAG: 3-oxoacyl-ACP synthase III family protein [Thermoanaerobaculia bacterium]
MEIRTRPLLYHFGMNSNLRSVIVGTGSSIPSVRVPNENFLSHEFWGADRKKIDKTNATILEQFESITGIRERRYAEDDRVSSDLASEAAREALASNGSNGEDLDGIIVAHNFGDVRLGSRRSDLVPSLAARVKHNLGIRNPAAAAFDLIFGCPGWLQGIIVADSMIRSGAAKRMMVIGSETLSRVTDPHDRDTLIYADGAGATILEGRESEDDAGVLAYTVRSDSAEQLEMLFMARSYHPDLVGDEIFLKMEGRKLYKYALQTVAGAILDCLKKAGIGLQDVKKVLIHQANAKMDEAILGALYQTAGLTPPDDVMPMTISWLGNSSVATIPTMLDLIVRGRLEPHTISKGDIVVFASVGAGMHINAAVYRWAS